MALVGKVGHKRLRARLAMFVLYLLLAIGAATTLYPFLLMALTGFKGPTDQNDGHFIPAYWSDVASKDSKGSLSDSSLLGKYLSDKYAGNLDQIESTRIGASASNQYIELYRKFLLTLPPEDFDAGFRTQLGQVTGRLAERYRSWLQSRYRNIDNVNRAYIEENEDFATVTPPTELLERKGWQPPKTAEYRDWSVFKAQLPAEFRIPIRATALYQEFLRSKYQNQISQVPTDVRGRAKAFSRIILNLEQGNRGEDPQEREFWQTAVPDRFRTSTVEDLWNRYLLTSPGHVLGPFEMPIEADEADFVHTNASEIRREFAGRNYRFVLDYVALNGRALWNTVIFCGLAILLQLIVNPLAAYALSRYPMKATAKILLYLLATMAFPAEVALIPSFLLLKQFHLLNTFAALVLPGAASGYMIFLLKGFFDSLPPELFEAGQIDGARESTMMLRIAMPLSRPVLGYLGLLAFMGAYGAFMFAFLVAQDQRIWTLMVWIYNLQTYAPKAVIMAALTIAAIPTLIVFLCAQRVIMQGIILPGER